MKIEQAIWTTKHGWEPKPPGLLGNSAQLVLLFASPQMLKDPPTFLNIKKVYPQAHILGCSTAGEICGTEVTDNSLVLTAIQFEHTQIKGICIPINDMKESSNAGERLIQSLDLENLVHVFVLSEGININGSNLVKGLTQKLPPHVTVTGGLSGDGDRFKETFVLWDGPAAKNSIAAIGLYGSRLKIGYSSFGGWDPFGPDRLITKSKDNILYELDGQSALRLYKKYLGEHAEKLPASGLLFPLSLRNPDGKDWVVRTILGINEQDQSMIFAGDLPQGSYARLMKANFERLIDGASLAAQGSYEAMGSVSPDLAILISCVGRKMILGQRIEEEVESVREVLGEKTVLTGFYSYGEISPFTPHAKCELHNQTMTITTFSER